VTATATVEGNLVRDPELRYLNDGTATAKFTVAVNHRKKLGSEWIDDGASFFTVIAWRGIAETVANTLEKGVKVVVIGTMKERSWKTNEGETKKQLEITATSVSTSLRAARSSGAARPSQSAPAPVAYDDEPF